MRKFVVLTKKDLVLTRKDLVITRKYVVLTRKDLVITRKRSRYYDIIEWKKYYVWAAMRHRNIVSLLHTFFILSYSPVLQKADAKHNNLKLSS